MEEPDGQPHRLRIGLVCVPPRELELLEDLLKLLEERILLLKVEGHTSRCQP